MTCKLKGLRLTEFSLVDRPANQEARIVIAKRDTGASGAREEVTKHVNDNRSMIQKAIDAILGAVKTAAESVAKSLERPTSFSQVIAANTLEDDGWKYWSALREVVRNIMADETVTDKQGAISLALDEFKQTIMAVTATAAGAVSKGDAPAWFDGDIAGVTINKAGKVVSAANLSKLKAAYAAIGELITAAGDEGSGEGAAQKRDDSAGKEEIDVSKAITEAVEKALNPIVEQIGEVGKRLDALEGKPTETEAVAKTEAEQAEAISKALTDALKPVQDNLAELGKRLEVVEQARGIKKSLDGQETDIKKDGDLWGGLILS